MHAIALLPLWLSFLVFFVTLGIISFLSYWLFSARLQESFWEYGTHDVGVSPLIVVLAGSYSILLGLVIISLWQNFNKIQGTISREASSFAIILIQSAVLPKPVTTDIRTAIKSYVVDAENAEWERNAVTGIPEAWLAMWNIFNTLQGYQPQTAFQTIYYSSVMAELKQALSARRERFENIRNTMPESLLYMLLLGAILINISLSLGTAISGKYLLFVNFSICCFMSLSLTIVIHLNTPAAGTFLVSNRPFHEGILKSLDSIP